MSPRPVRKRSRARQRGTLIVETLVVVPMLIALCGIGFWFYQVHTAQMKVYRSVREPVWATATYGCGQAGETSHSMPGPQGGVSVANGAPPAAGDFSQVYESVPGGPNNEVITRPIGRANGSAQETVSGFKVTWFAPKPTNYDATATMQCNEAVHDGKPDAAKRLAAVAFSP